MTSQPRLSMQRYRKTPALRRFFAEHTLRPEYCIQPIFIHETLTEPRAIETLPGIMQHTLSSLNDELNSIWQSGVRAVILFGIPGTKDSLGLSASNPDGIVQKAIRHIKAAWPELIVIADCCLCEYTSHGHCGVLGPCPPYFDHHATLARLNDIALSYAQAGVDVIAPSGMLDGMIASLREALDTHGFGDILLMSYAVKYASAFYGPFRDAAGSGDVFVGNRRHHQMAISQREEALREAQLDQTEGADILMVKPGMPYLDILSELRREMSLPLAVYQVSGEYAMLHAAAKAGICGYEAAMAESLTAFIRAGAHWIITYGAKDVHRFVQESPA